MESKTSGDYGESTDPQNIGRGVFHLEDDDQSAQGFAKKSEVFGIGVERHRDVVEARPILETHHFPVLVVDLEVFDDGIRRVGAGGDLIKEVSSGALGAINMDSTIIVHTAHFGEFEHSGLDKIDRVQLVRKPGSVFLLVRQILFSGAVDPVVLEVQPYCLSKASDHFVEVAVLGWRDMQVELPITMFGVDGNLALAVADSPVYFSALANLSANTADDLRIDGIELVLGADEKERELWTD